MADIKISALPVAGALAASDVLPMVQPSGTTKVALSVLDSRWAIMGPQNTITGPVRINVPGSAAGIPSQPQLIVSGLSSSASQWATLAVISTDPQAADKGGSINLGGSYTTSRDPTVWARVFGGKDTSVDGEFGGYLSLSTRPNGGSMTERFRIASTGACSLGGTLAIGTNPATTGAVRLANNQHIYARNAANTGDQSLVYVSTADQVFVGFGSSSVVTNCTSQVITAINGVNQVQVFDGMMRFRDNFILDAGTTTGLRIGNTATQKLGFYGATPVVRPTGTPAAATDPATTMALVNSLRASLIALGLIS